MFEIGRATELTVVRLRALGAQTLHLSRQASDEVGGRGGRNGTIPSWPSSRLSEQRLEGGGGVDLRLIGHTHHMHGPAASLWQRAAAGLH